jgi:predicted DNA-binding transcriptional regulator AlpA
MSVQSMNDKPLKAAVSVAEMCRLLQMSRSQFYWHVKRGTFHEPLRLASNNRPYFTASMVDDNLRVRQTGVNVNDEYVIFYERRAADDTKPTGKKPKADHSSLIQGLKSFGISSITPDQVESALDACFPGGTRDKDEIEVLRAIFRHLKRTGAG